MPVTVTLIAAAAGAGCRGTVDVSGWVRGDWGKRVERETIQAQVRDRRRDTDPA